MPNHIHTYEKMRDRPDYYRCIDPICSHYTKKTLLIGKLGLCPSCRSQFILDRNKMRRAKPTCDACSNSKKGKEIRRIAGIPELSEMFANIPDNKTPEGEGSL